jgi:hypothetical protein
MNRPATAPPNCPPDFSRSEAFAEDLFETYAQATERRRAPRWMGLLPMLPLLVALVGLAFAVLPPT